MGFCQNSASSNNLDASHSCQMNEVTHGIGIQRHKQSRKANSHRRLYCLNFGPGANPKQILTLQRTIFFF